jgi:hypothetical protein
VAIGKAVALIVSITGDTSGLRGALGDAGKDVKGFGGISLATAAKVTVVAGVAIAATEALIDMGNAAAKDKAEHEKLLRVIENAGAATAESTAQVEEAIKAGQRLAFTDSETRLAMQSLVTATKDTEEATKLLAVANDVARFANVDLATAADAVAKAHAGNDKALRSLIPGIDKGATALDTIAAASKIAEGSALDYSKTSEGVGKRVKDSFGEVAEKLGSALIPIMEALLPALEPFVELVSEWVDLVLPIAIPLIQGLAWAFSILTAFIRGTIGVVKEIIRWVEDLIGAVEDALDALAQLNPFASKPMRVGHFSGGGTGATGGTNPFLAGNLVFNIYGDPALIETTVVRALDNYTRKNGIAPVVGLER